MSLYTDITNTIVAQLEAGVRPWARSWGEHEGFGRPIRATGERYGGINILLLQSAALVRGFSQPRWMTFNQALAAGACVRKGETSSKVVFASTFSKDVETAKGEIEEKNIGFLKQYSVFNVEQIDGLGPEYFSTPSVVTPAVRDARAEAFVATLGVDLRLGGSRACYVPSLDRVHMPAPEMFHGMQAYYATLAHEFTHWTGAEARLARTMGKRFGDRAYAFEELVAEMGAAFLCADLGLAVEPREDHASYIASWIDGLKSDPRAIFSAASMASKAVEYMHGLAAGEIVASLAPSPATLAKVEAARASQGDLFAVAA